MLLGADKRAAAEFSFFLAMPTMVGAFAYDLYKSRAEMTTDHLGIIAIGFVVSFITAIIVVKTFLELRHPPRLRAVRVVARDRRHARPGRAGDGEVDGFKRRRPLELSRPCGSARDIAARSLPANPA